MAIEEDKFALEKARHDFEQAKFSKSEEREERRFKADQSARRWSQIATFIPILAIIFGLYGNVYLESVKHTNATTSTQLKLRREFIDRQLSDFYYPIKMRLEKDTAIWQLSGQLSEKNRIRTGDNFSKYIENSVLIPNHEEIISIISKNFGLIKNADEQYDTKPLIKSINHYQRHFSAYKTLRTQGIYNINPTDVCKGCEWPDSLPKLINERILQLENQREALSGE
jgi:predicted RND superfamily exporter protein